MRSKEEIIKEISLHGFPSAISYTDFFEGNNFDGTIGVNIYPDPPSPQRFFEIFNELISSGLASEIYIPISDTEDTLEWFYADSAYVVGKLTKDELFEAVKELRPDEIYDGWLYGKPRNINVNESDKNIFTLWWD